MLQSAGGVGGSGGGGGGIIGGGDGSAGPWLGGSAAAPVSTIGSRMLPTLLPPVNVGASAAMYTVPSSRSSNVMDSPCVFAYTWKAKIGLPAYGPNGGGMAAAAEPRSSVPTNARMEPEP